MVKTQIQLPEADLATLRRLAAEEGISVSELVRRGVRCILDRQNQPTPKEQWQRAMSLAGKFRSGKSDIAERHDDYLAEDMAK
jgi:hypothetical protein